MGGYLAELTTVEEDIPLENYLVQGIFYWIGLSDAASEETWRWMESHQKQKESTCREEFQNASIAIKNSRILPTGQWYAPSAVINIAKM